MLSEAHCLCCFVPTTNLECKYFYQYYHTRKAPVHQATGLITDRPAPYSSCVSRVTLPYKTNSTALKGSTVPVRVSERMDLIGWSLPPASMAFQALLGQRPSERTRMQCTWMMGRWGQGWTQRGTKYAPRLPHPSSYSLASSFLL